VLRVILRPPTLDDERALLQAARRSRRLHKPWVYAPRNRRQFLTYLDRISGDASVGYMVCRKEDAALVGVVNINNIIRMALQSASLGFYALEPHTGQGYMTEGVALSLRRAFIELRLHRVEANVQPGNERSLALLRRLGFVNEGFSPRFLKVGGRWRDHERWAMTREQWLAERRRYPR
jgi:ribosomal-protein-alanine N-acetyltransferase